jgi:hypothetical protein
MSNRDLIKDDRVMLSHDNVWMIGNDNPLGVVGTVSYDISIGWISVYWDNGTLNTYYEGDSDLVKVRELEFNEELEEGDRVMLLATTKNAIGPTNPLGVKGTATYLGKHTLSVRWDTGEENVYYGEDNELVKVES